MGIVIGEHRLIKVENRVGERLLGTVLPGRIDTEAHTNILYEDTQRIQTQHTRAQTLLQASETLCHYVLWRQRQIWPNGFLN